MGLFVHLYLPHSENIMAIQAIVFDIGGVLEFTPRTGWIERWEAQLQLQPGGFQERLGEVWAAGSLGTISLEDVERRISKILKLDPVQVAALMQDSWHEYVGTLNVELTAYFARLRPRYRTAIISNSFVGAREREQELYQFADLCDLIIYSHEVGVAKPERRIFELACAQLGVLPAEMVFLDDVEVNVEAARQLGIYAILFQNTAQAISDIEAVLGEATTHVDSG